VSQFVGAVILGLAFGSVYALLSVGLVLTYRTTGIFNLAFGPVAFFVAAVYYDTHITHHWPMYLALLFSVGVVAPGVGLLLDRALFRFLRTASETAKLVSVLGLFVAIPNMVFLWFGQNTKAGAVGIVPHGSNTYSPLHNVFVSRDDLAIAVMGAVVFVVLSLMLRYTAIGLRMRAVVESPRLTELAGVNSDRVSMSSWMLSSFIAGIAGVLLTPVFAGQVGYQAYEALVIAAIAAAVLGGLGSIPLAYAGGLLLGVFQQLLFQYLPTNNIIASAFKPALPFVVAFAVLVLSPVIARRRSLSDPLSGVDPPPPAPAHAERSEGLTRMTRGFAVVFFAIVGYWLFFHANSSWIDLAVRAAILSIIFLSITVITGFAGQISLCQASFAAVGAAATAQLATNVGLPVISAMFVGAAIAAAVGALLAIPMMRLGGIFLSLATLAFAFFFDQVVLQLGWVGAGTQILVVPRPVLGSIDFSKGDKAYLVLTLIILTLVSLAVIWVRGGTAGRSLDAMRGSEVAASAIGINHRRARIVAFALSAAIAGLGGGLMITYTHLGTASNIDSVFVPELGLAWIVLVVTLGARTIEGAINAAVGFVFFQAVVLPTWLPFAVDHVQPWYHVSALPPALQPILFGLGALTYAKHPEGILEFQKRRSYARVQGLINRFGRNGKADSAAPDDPGGTRVVATAGSGS
jgi:branched-subunit amino acid ABC-type transport system permease component